MLVIRWREGEGVVSDLNPGKSSGGRGRQYLRRLTPLDMSVWVAYIEPAQHTLKVRPDEPATAPAVQRRRSPLDATPVSALRFDALDKLPGMIET